LRELLVDDSLKTPKGDARVLGEREIVENEILDFLGKLNATRIEHGRVQPTWSKLPKVKVIR
jgi:hypothetical protein